MSRTHVQRTAIARDAIVLEHFAHVVESGAAPVFYSEVAAALGVKRPELISSLKRLRKSGALETEWREDSSGRSYRVSVNGRLSAWSAPEKRTGLRLDYRPAQGPDVRLRRCLRNKALKCAGFVKGWAGDRICGHCKELSDFDDYLSAFGSTGHRAAAVRIAA